MKKLIGGIMIALMVMVSSCTPSYAAYYGGWKQVHLEPNGSLPVTLQDQTTPPLIVNASDITATTTLAVETVEEDRTVTVVSAAGMSVGDLLGLFDTIHNRYYAGYITAINSNVLSMDSPIDHVYIVGTIVGTGDTNLAVDGSVTPVIYTLRGADPGIALTVDVTRIMFYCITSTATELTDFGDIAGGLTNGLLIRRTNGYINNIANFKSNIQMKGIMYDWEALSASNPGQGLYGFSGRLTFGGQNKMGVVLRVGPGESVQLMVQDNLSTLVALYVIFEGHIAIVD